MERWRRCIRSQFAAITLPLLSDCVAATLRRATVSRASNFVNGITCSDYLTLVFWVAELLFGVISCVVAVTFAVSLSVVPAAAATVTPILMVAVAPLARVPRSIVTVPLVPTGGDVTVP